MQEVLTFEGHPGRSLQVWLFRDVNNCREIQRRISDPSFQLDVAFVNAALVPDVFILHLAAHKALTASVRGFQRARSLHAELVCTLSGSRHIGESLKRFGVGEQCQHLLAARFDATSVDEAEIHQLVKGTPAPLSELPNLTDRQLLQKYHKLTTPEQGALVDSIVSHMAARDC